MNGNNFKAVYKASMNNITPDDELLKQIRLAAAKEADSPPQIQNKSFFGRHRALLTAAAAAALVIGIFTIGTVIISNSYLMESGSAAPGAAGNKEGSSHYDYNGFISPDGDCEEIYSPEPPKDNISEEIKSEASADKTVPPGGITAAPGTNYQDEYSDEQLFLLSEKAKDGTLTPDDIGKITTIKEEENSYHVFAKFCRNGIYYVLSADFETPKGNPISLTISEADNENEGRGIDLIKSFSHLEEYFSGVFTENL